MVLPALGVAILLMHVSASFSGSSDAGSPDRTSTTTTTAAFLVSLVVIVLAARTFGSIAVRFGQPRVIGEILAGIALGPSLLGLVPGAEEALFPERVTPYLDTLSQLGLVLFMFLVGAELDVHRLRGTAKITLVLGHAGIVIPGALAALLAVVLYPHYAPSGTGQLVFVLFFGLALSVTAFPVLARFLTDRNMQNSAVGTLALAAAAVADVTAWCLLAIVISIQGNDPWHSARTIGLSMLFVLVMVVFVRPALRRLMAARIPDSALLVALVCGALVAALTTELIGVHTIFGAFLFGAVLQHDSPRLHEVTQKLETFCLSLLLPVFFTQMGLEFRLFDIEWSAAMWGLCLTIIGVATLGKLGGSTVTLRMCGRPWREAATVGALTNCRGLTELVVLNVGLQLGILDLTLFTLLVIMAIVATVLTGPLVNILYREEPVPAPEPHVPAR
ncbi:cation:proton antiporter [Streptomyces sulphureus]|uniref:cation:proton antiporter domain-containing protein n=1 Tax=Streptomyces sulphureus TaxID=47758 RepID=UPI000368072F|nr:cation:proton antiporter [Streptomyces sulphureus]